MDKFLFTFREFAYSQLALVELRVIDVASAVRAITSYVSGMKDVFAWDPDEEAVTLLKQAEATLLEKILRRYPWSPAPVSLSEKVFQEKVEMIRAEIAVEPAVPILPAMRSTMSVSSMSREDIDANLSRLLRLENSEKLDMDMTLDEYGVFCGDLDFKEDFEDAFGIRLHCVAGPGESPLGMTVGEIVEVLLSRMACS